MSPHAAPLPRPARDTARERSTLEAPQASARISSTRCARTTALAHAEQRLGQRLLAFADEHRVEERCIGLGVKDAGPAANARSDRPARDRPRAGGGPTGRALRDVGRRELMRQRDTDGVEFRKRSAAFERERRDALFAHEVRSGRPQAETRARQRDSSVAFTAFTRMRTAWFGCPSS